LAEDIGTELGETGREGGLVAPSSNGHGTRRTSLALALLRTARPRQWVKNVLVAAAPGAAGVLTHGDALVKTIIAFVAFTLAASGTYFLNDALDVEADRRHPKKRRRPIAAGEVPVLTAKIVGVVLIVAGVGVGFAANWRLPVVVACYVALTTSYSIWLKHMAVIDLGAVAAGFVLRMIGGAVAVNVPISNWFFIVASFGSLFVVAGKRHAEHRELGAARADHRTTLAHYTTEYLGYVVAVSSGVAMVAYCLWAFEKAHGHSGVPWFELSIVPFVLGVLRYALIVDTGGGAAPEEIVLGDRALQVMGVLWAIAVAVGIYVS
jgi:decaprenyl-phosphate phosphoribosyltransferase